MYIKHIFFDMDDTLTNTDQHLKNQIRQHFIAGNDPQGLVVFDNWLLLKKTTLQLPDVLSKLSFEHGLKEGDFMLNVKPSPLLWELSWFINLLVELRNKGIQLHVCSHRGWHPKGETYTKQWLSNLGLLKYFDDVIMLDSSKNPSKIKYLEDHYDDFIIIDDNPLHDINAEHPKDNRLLIYTGIGNYRGYKNQLHVNSIADIRKVVLLHP